MNVDWDQIPNCIQSFRDDPRLLYFPNFLYLGWQHLGLPEPTPIQYYAAHVLQHGPDRLLFKGFRGLGKSWICSMYGVHCFGIDPVREKIMVVSAGKQRADQFAKFTRQLLEEWDLVEELRPEKDALRDSTVAYDVRGAGLAHAPSMTSLGISGQLTGSRATKIIFDDVESKTNSETPVMREKLLDRVQEFANVLSPEGAGFATSGQIRGLGTDQTEESIYRTFPEKGYKVFVVPAEYPQGELAEALGGDLAEPLAEALEENPELAGRPTEPLRFPAEELQKREAELGRSAYRLQFMLDPRMSDLDKYPLRLSDLLVMDVDRTLAPERVVYAATPECEIHDLVNVGFKSDRYYRPLRIVGDMIPYQGKILAVDPSGKGKDETAWAVIGALNGFLYVLDMGASLLGSEESVLEAIAHTAKVNRVDRIVAEANFGDGMFTRLLTPFLTREDPATGKPYWPCAIEEVKHHTQKERRIIDTLEPVLSNHRLIVGRHVLEHDLRDKEGLAAARQVLYRFAYQLSRLTRDRNCLAHDDRLEVVAMAVNAWVEAMDQDADAQRAARQEAQHRKQLEDFIRHAKPSAAPGARTWLSSLTGR